MTPFSDKIETVIQGMETDAVRGLTEDQVAKRLAQYGPNELKGKPAKSLLARFFAQFKDVMILILIVAAIISFVIACIEGELREFFEPILIIAIVVINAVMGVVQESKAEKALEALKNMSAPHARVMRDGHEMVIDATGLAPGDIILIEAGDFVPADARLIDSASLKSEESALTGESVPAEKDAAADVPEQAPLGDRHNMIYSGCSIAYGRGRAVVTATGMDTEMGKIANLLEGAEESQTPLQKKLADMGKYLGIVALAACAVIFVMGLINKLDPVHIFMTAVSLAVSAIPEGLPAIVTIVLAIGVQRMVKKNAIIRRLPAVETLGSASVICSDKTGTLTQNRMTITNVYADGEASDHAFSDRISNIERDVVMYGALCCDGNVVMENGAPKHIGDPTETAIVWAAMQCGMARESINEKYPRISEIPFESDRKLMTTIHKIDGKIIGIVKGAFDQIKVRCSAGDTSRAEEIVKQMSSQALRVLAVAYRVFEEAPTVLTSENVEKDLTFMGLVGMIDPPRPEVRDAVHICREAGITPVMITGDYVLTASAIATDLGMMKEGSIAISGAELQEMTDEQLDACVRDVSVYARVSPEDKIRIVRAWQRKGEIVSMTGDGVNDAPALKAADIGCAMGITGTDVAKGAADMTLTDDNFATIVDAIREGRGIYDNIKKVVAFLLGTNIGEVLAVFTAMLVWKNTPLLSMQLLMINLVTDSLPAIALGMESVDGDIMKKKPKPKDEGIFANGLGVRIFLQGALFAILSLFAFWYGKRVTGLEAGGQTLTFLVLALSQVVHSFNMRSDKSLFAIGPFTNKQLNLSAIAGIAIIAALLFIPQLSYIFSLIALPAHLYLLGVGLSFVSIVLLELFKAVGIIRHK